MKNGSFLQISIILVSVFILLNGLAFYDGKTLDEFLWGVDSEPTGCQQDVFNDCPPFYITSLDDVSGTYFLDDGTGFAIRHKGTDRSLGVTIEDCENSHYQDGEMGNGEMLLWEETDGVCYWTDSINEPTTMELRGGPTPISSYSWTKICLTTFSGCRNYTVFAIVDEGSSEITSASYFKADRNFHLLFLNEHERNNCFMALNSKIVDSPSNSWDEVEVSDWRNNTFEPEVGQTLDNFSHLCKSYSHW